jgi:membrane associated rhomboid family serine protease
MLILPYQTRFTARSLPVVTLALVAFNVLVYLVLQSGDSKAYQRAADYYVSAQLAQIELPRYAAYLERRNDRKAMQVLRAIRSGPAEDDARAVLMVMQRDREFMKDLAADAVVSKEEPLYPAWKEQRDRFHALWVQVFTERFALEPGSASVLRLITYQFLHGGALHLLGNMAVLLLAGPFAEAALGRLRFLIAYIASGAIAGAVHLLISDQGLIGASGAISGTMAMVAVLYGTRKVPVFYWLFVYFNTARVPALWLLPVWLAIEAVQWALSPATRVAYDAHIAGFISGAILAWLLKPADMHKVDRILEEQYAAAPAERRSTLLNEARQAAAKLDTRRAARAYAELLEDEPTNTQYASAYFNMALLGRDKDTLADAALRALWIRTRQARTELRPVYTQLSQPHVLSVLPVDEQLRLARRLVATREDAAALRVLDGLLGNDTMRNLYGRQLADCLLGLFTTYSRHGLRQQADHVRQRLSQHFPSPGTLGGLAPSREPPLTIRGSTTRGAGPRGNPATVPTSDLELDLDLDTRLHTRFGTE